MTSFATFFGPRSKHKFLMTAPSNVQTILWRVCWNDCGWQKPSGGFKEPGYPADHGFGHEEWNFRLEDAIGGRVYGYIYKTRIKRASELVTACRPAVDGEARSVHASPFAEVVIAPPSPTAT
jgi:hypothetical protein